MKRAIMIFALVSTVAGVASAQMLRSSSEPGALAKATTLILPPARPESAEVRATPTLIARQAPVPMQFHRRPPAFVPAAGKEPTLETVVPDTASAETAVRSLAENDARAAIEADGYKRVRVVSKTADGTWRARALRGTTEVALSVDAQGHVIGD